MTYQPYPDVSGVSKVFFCFHVSLYFFHVNFICNMTTFRIMFNIFFFGGGRGEGGWGNILITVMLMYRHWVVMPIVKSYQIKYFWRNEKFITQK